MKDVCIKCNQRKEVLSENICKKCFASLEIKKKIAMKTRQIENADSVNVNKLICIELYRIRLLLESGVTVKK